MKASQIITVTLMFMSAILIMLAAATLAPSIYDALNVTCNSFSCPPDVSGPNEWYNK